MTVASLQLLFDRGETSVRMKVAAPAQVDAALRCMLAERSPQYAHRLALRMADGGLVIAKPRAA